jgi:starch synthase
MRIFFVINEAHPLYKIGGLGDVGGSLPKALKNLGEDISLVIPKHPEIKLSESPEEVASFKINYKNNLHNIKIIKTTLPDTSIPVYLVDELIYLSTHSNASDNHADKYSVFSLAVSQWLSSFSKLDMPEIIHLNDWHTSLIPVICTHLFNIDNVKYLITIHNLMYQGNTNTPILKNLNLPPESCQILSMDDDDNYINILLEGLLHSDIISTVSPTYAKEILTFEYGEKIDQIISLRKKDIVGILNGLDLETFNPETDPNLYTNYSAKTVSEGKKQNKTSLQKEIGLEQDGEKILIGFVGRVDGGQKGIQLIVEAIQKNTLINDSQQFVFLGTGDPNLESQLHQASNNRFNIRIITRYDESLAAKIYAASDLLLIPSKFEPCGLIQMIAMRYGTIPIARATGGLKDTINDQKDGFLFKDYSATDMVNCLQKSISIFSSSPTKEYMIQSAMSKDFSWQESAKKYQQLYRDLLRG